MQLLLDEMCAYQEALMKAQIQDEAMAEAEREARSGQSARKADTGVVHIGEDVAAQVKRMRGEG